MMQILVIEDELPAAERLISIIRSRAPDATILGPLESNDAILQWFSGNEKPDLIFSDIELLDGPVFSALEQLHLQVPIIFTTAYDHYTLEAFETSGISYLTKPFEQVQVQAALDKFYGLKQTFQEVDQVQLIANLKKLSQSSSSYRTRLTIKLGQGIHLLQVAEITCIRTSNGLPFAHKIDGKKLPLAEQMGDLDSMLNPAEFFRINRGEIVNIGFIERVEGYFNDRLAVLVKGQQEPLITSASRTAEFRKWLG